jgi:GxxExxY protein
MDVTYKDRKIGTIRADIVCYGELPLIIETKSTWQIRKKDMLQLGKYMRSMDIEYGVLVNFSFNELEIDFFLIVEYKDNDVLVRYNPETRAGYIIR